MRPCLHNKNSINKSVLPKKYCANQAKTLLQVAELLKLFWLKLLQKKPTIHHLLWHKF